MLSQRNLFLQNLAQTSDFPVMLEVESAKGIYIFDTSGKKYIDIISGISVSNLGHCHPNIIKAVKDQADKYFHTMVYGEYVLSPQVLFAEKLTELLPHQLNSVYLVNSGSEAVEGAVKLAKRYTERFEIVSFKNAYHGSTQGALSLMGNETMKNSFRPLLPGIRFAEFNIAESLEIITEKTACVIVEPVQGEAGIIVPENNFLLQLRQRCDETGTLLIFDEIQTGFGRTGFWFAFEKYKVIPDILTIAKGAGGGMPLGAFISSKKIMDSLKNNPVLGHITTFGGHPISCAAALANLNTLLEEKWIEKVSEKEMIFRKYLNHPSIKEIRGTGLFLAIQLTCFEQVQKVIAKALQNGLITDWFLFCDSALRIAPPLIISDDEIEQASKIICSAIEESGKGN